MHPDSPETSSEGPSKSQRKRDARALFELGRDLVALPTARLRTLPIDEDLAQEIAFARSIHANAAKKRHLQYIAKLLRNSDVGPLLDALEDIRLEARKSVVAHHRTEAWRDRLLAGGDEALSDLCKRYEISDVQTLRQLLRNARREASEDRPPAAARKLFKLLRDLDASAPLPESPEST